VFYFSGDGVMLKELAMVALLSVAPESDANYDRQAMYGRWADEDGNCRNTRHEVLAAESLVPVEGECKVLSGLWYDPFTTQTFNDPEDVDIDHLVPLKEAHESGAWKWHRYRQRAYANDLDNPGHLIAVDDETNQRKSARDPAEWLPPNAAYHCAYVATWVQIKYKWHLSIDPAEKDAIVRVLEGC